MLTLYVQKVFIDDEVLKVMFTWQKLDDDTGAMISSKDGKTPPWT